MRIQEPRYRTARTARLTLLLALLIALGASLAASRAVSADGGAPNLVYVAGAGSDASQLAVVDIAQRHVTARIPIGHTPSGVVLSPDSRFAYVTQASANQLAVVDTQKKAVSATLPIGAEPTALVVQLTRFPARLFVALTGGNAVAVVDPDTRHIAATIPVGNAPSGLAIAYAGSGIRSQNPGDSELYVANAGSDSVSVISLATLTVMATIPAPGGPLGVVVPATGGIAYVTTRAGTVLALSLADHTLLGTLLQLHGPPGTMDYDAVTGQIYVPDPTGSAVAVLRPASATVGASGAVTLPAEPARTLPFAGGPIAVAITFDGSYGFIAEHDSGHLMMLDAAANQTLATVDVGGKPVALVTGAYPPALSSTSALTLGYVLGGLALVALLAMGTAFFIHSRRAPQRARQRTRKGSA